MKGNGMVSSKKYRKIPLILLGFFVFFLVLGITFSDAYGMERLLYGRPGTNNSPSSSTGIDPFADWYDMTIHNAGDNFAPTNCEPSPVPEPASLMLLVLGLGTLALCRKRK